MRDNAALWKPPLAFRVDHTAIVRILQCLDAKVITRGEARAMLFSS